MKEDLGFMERISRDLEARKAACKILGVGERASKDQLKKAYWQAAIRCHPDHNQSDPGANERFALVKCAYELLASDEPCDRLSEEISSLVGIVEDDKYNLDNSWGYFLWWRDKFFD